MAYQQNLHFKQLFKVIELMGLRLVRRAWSTSPSAWSRYEGSALSTREGYVVYLEDLLNKAIEKAREIIEEKSPESGQQGRGRPSGRRGRGSLSSTLHNDRIKDIDFRWERALNFDGETGPYVQYTHARCCSRAAQGGGVRRGRAGLQRALPTTRRRMC